MTIKPDAPSAQAEDAFEVLPTQHAITIRADDGTVFIEQEDALGDDLHVIVIAADNVAKVGERLLLIARELYFRNEDQPAKRADRTAAERQRRRRARKRSHSNENAAAEATAQETKLAG